LGGYGLQMSHSERSVGGKRKKTNQGSSKKPSKGCKKKPREKIQLPGVFLGYSLLVFNLLAGRFIQLNSYPAIVR